MAINLNDNLLVNAPKAADKRYGPYPTREDALAALPSAVRFEGLTVGTLSGGLKEYWFKGGIADENLIEKIAGEPTSGIPLSTIEAKGDLIVGLANETPGRLPVGNNGEFLVADSAEPLGVKWVVVGDGDGQVITTTFTTEALDPDEYQDFTLDLGDTVALVSLAVAGSPEDAWVRVYTSSAGRASDTRTDPGIPFPPSSSGFAAEVVTNPTTPEVIFLPAPTIYSPNGLFLRLTNQSASSQSFVLTVIYLTLGVEWVPFPTNLSYNNSNRTVNSNTGTGAQLPLFTSTISGLVPYSGGGTSNYLRADGNWDVPPGGDITVSTEATTITNAVGPATLSEVNPTQNTNFDGSSDEGSVEVPLGFSVEILGNSYSSVFVNSNSYFTFGGMTAAYGETTYNDWIQAVPHPGVFVGSDDGSYQKVTSTGAIGTLGQRTSTVRFQGSVDFANTDPNLSDVFWEITFHEDEPGKIYLNIIEFNDQGGSEGADFFSFSSLGVTGQPESYVSFSPATGSQYVITLDSVTATTDYTGSKLVLLDPGVSVSENIPQNSVDVSFGLSDFVKSDITIDPSFNKISNIVSLTQADYDGLTTPDPNTLYVIVN